MRLLRPLLQLPLLLLLQRLGPERRLRGGGQEAQARRRRRRGLRQVRPLRRQRQRVHLRRERLLRLPRLRLRQRIAREHHGVLRLQRLRIAGEPPPQKNGRRSRHQSKVASVAFCSHLRPRPFV